MVGGGLPEPRSDHATAVAEMALAMVDAIGKVGDNSGVQLQVRIGVNTGALIAGVIGTHKFVYDVWGDTVNIAKRMESYGQPGRIHVSAATREVYERSVPLRTSWHARRQGSGTCNDLFPAGQLIPID